MAPYLGPATAKTLMVIWKMAEDPRNKMGFQLNSGQARLLRGRKWSHMARIVHAFSAGAKRLPVDLTLNDR